ncbi:hypothetical protein [Streptomyces sp. 11x1]|uniref:hypothetical protein n=1 Tax=Streptomyces sp. 11x1 TaxID=3038642 RepID=UPI00292D2D79|nr:hypothetical protein [Streptomyces sp. 11x1]WNZ13571.1 hypothetical protein P8T65_42410 [Streptomyces sp. 11x1]
MMSELAASIVVLLENGFDVTVFDKYRQVGGVWSSGGCYDGLANQSALRIFEFADLPNRLHFASAADTQRYLENYAETFCVLDRVRPGTEVISIPRWTALGGWAPPAGRSTLGPLGPRRRRFIAKHSTCLDCHPCVHRWPRGGLSHSRVSFPSVGQL